MMERTTVAVVGLGAASLVALKNLKEQDFDRRARIRQIHEEIQDKRFKLKEE